MPKIGFPTPTAKNRFQIPNLHPKKHIFNKKNMVLKEKITKNAVKEKKRCFKKCMSCERAECLREYEVPRRQTENYNEIATQTKKKTQQGPSVGVPWHSKSSYVPAKGIRTQRNSLSPHPKLLLTAVLARTTGKLPKHHNFAKSVSNTIASCLSRHGQPTAIVIKKGDSSIVYVLKILSSYPR